MRENRFHPIRLLTLALAATLFGGCQGPAGTPGTDGQPGTPAVDRGTISGSVADPASVPLAGVSIATQPASTTATTDAAGAFSLANVPIGVYSVVGTLAGYQDFTLTGVGVAAGGTTNVSLAMTPMAPTAGSIAGTVYQANGTPLAGATVTAEGQAASATSGADGTYTLSDVTPGFVFVHVDPPDPALFLPGETRRSVFVAAGATASVADVTLSGRPGDSATYAGSTACAVCHTTHVADERTSAHYRSLTLDASRIIRTSLFPAVGGTVTTGVNALSPADGVTSVAVYACQNVAGAYGFKFGGTADCAVADGTLVPIAGTYGGEGDGGINNIPNVGVYKQRFFALLDDVPVAASWTYTTGRAEDRLILPVQITQSGDGGPRFGAYHGTDWTVRGRTFSRACAGCHNVGLQIAWDSATNITSFSYLDLNVGCESCHGPGSDHLAASLADKPNKIISIRNLTASSQRQSCGGCHSADDGTSLDPLGAFAYPYNVANASLVGGGMYVPGVFSPADYINGYGVPSAAGGSFNAWPDGIHGKAHRQQVPMVDASVHANNPYLRLVCSDCHNPHTLQQGPRALEAESGADTYAFTTPTFNNNVLCLGCHSTHGPYTTLSKDDVAIAFLSAGGAVSRNGTAIALGDFTSTQITAALVNVAATVGDHMQTEVGMGVAAYAPLNNAMPVGRCTSCHMPKTARSGGYTTGLDAAGASALVAGDQGSHVFDVVWPAQSAALRRPAGGADTDIMPNSCGGCHLGARLSGN